MKEEKILVFDQATVKTGISVFTNNTLQRYDLIDLHKEKSDTKFYNMCSKICEIIISEKPNYIVFEDVNFQTNAKTLILLAQLQGVIIGCCQLNHIEYTIYKPTSWRKLLGFKQGKVERKELKQQAKDYVKNKYGLDVNDDIADAICIGEAFITEKEKRNK